MKGGLRGREQPGIKTPENERFVINLRPPSSGPFCWRETRVPVEEQACPRRCYRNATHARVIQPRADLPFPNQRKPSLLCAG